MLSLVLKAVHVSELPSAQILSVWSFGFVVYLFTVSIIVLWSVSFFPLSVSRPMLSIFSLVICFSMFASYHTVVNYGFLIRVSVLACPMYRFGGCVGGLGVCIL